MKKQNKILTGITVLLITILFSCSKARIEKPTAPDINSNTDESIELIKFVPLDSFFSAKLRKPEIFNYTFPYNSSQYYPKTTMGTVIASTKYIFTSFSGDTIDYPYIISVNEFYKIKDIIYTKHQPVYDDKLMSLFGIFTISFSKDNFPLKIISRYGFRADNHTTEIATDSLPIYKLSNEEWILSNNTFIGDSTAFYGQLNITGWLLFGRESNFNTTNYTKIKFTSNKYDLTNIGIYIVFSTKNTFTRVENQESINLPVGEQAKLVAFGITEEGQLYSFNKDIIIGEQTSYEIDLSITNDTSLSLILDSL